MTSMFVAPRRNAHFLIDKWLSQSKRPREMLRVILEMGTRHSTIRPSLRRFIQHIELSGGQQASSNSSLVCLPSLYLNTPLILILSIDTLNTTTPLVSKLLLTWLTEAYVYHRLTDEETASGILGKPRGIGYGIGLAFAIFVMQGRSPPFWIMVVDPNLYLELASLVTFSLYILI